MFRIDEDKTIHITRGDVGLIEVEVASNGGAVCEFLAGTVLMLRVFEKKNFEAVVLQKRVTIEEATTKAEIYLEKDDTKIGELIHKPKDYWYEIEMNPDTQPQTIVAYDEEGEKVFRLYPEGSDCNE